MSSSLAFNSPDPTAADTPETDYVERAIWRLGVVRTLVDGSARDTDNALYRADLLAIGAALADIAAELRDEHDARREDALPAPVRDAVTALLVAVRETAKPARRTSETRALRVGLRVIRCGAGHGDLLTGSAVR